MPSPIRAFRALAFALMAALVVIGIALAFVVGNGGRTRNGHTVHTHSPSVWIYLVILVLGVIAAGLVQGFGYRIQPLSPDLDESEARAAGIRLYQQSMILRFALSEWVALVSIVLLFSIPSNSVLPYVEGGVISFALMAVHVWPSRSLIRRVQAKLDRGGGRSELAAALAG